MKASTPKSRKLFQIPETKKKAIAAPCRVHLSGRLHRDAGSLFFGFFFFFLGGGGGGLECRVRGLGLVGFGV